MPSQLLSIPSLGASLRLARTAFLLALLDAPFVAIVGMSVYAPMLRRITGSVDGNTPVRRPDYALRVGAAALCYLLLAAGLHALILEESRLGWLASGEAVRKGFVFGVVTWGVFGLTSMAIFGRLWGACAVLWDLVWGGVLCATVAYLLS